MARPRQPLIWLHSRKTFRAPRLLTLCVPFFSCYAVKAGGSEGNGTALAFPERSRSQLSGFHRTRCLSPAPARSNFPGSCRPRRPPGSLPAPRRPPGIHPGSGRGWRPGRLAGNTAHFPLNLSAAPGPGPLPARLVQPCPTVGIVGQASGRAGLEPGISGPSRGSFHDFKLPVPAFMCLGRHFFFLFSIGP